MESEVLILMPQEYATSGEGLFPTGLRLLELGTGVGDNQVIPAKVSGFL